MEQQFDPVEGMEAEKTARDVPAGYWALFLGLVIFGIVYAALYTPVFSGWSQETEYRQSLAGE